MNDFAEDAIEPLIVEKAQDYRRNNPGLGCAKLYLIIKDMFEETGCMPGRDAETLYADYIEGKRCYIDYCLY